MRINGVFKQYHLLDNVLAYHEIKNYIARSVHINTHKRKLSPARYSQRKTPSKPIMAETRARLLQNTEKIFNRKNKPRPCLYVRHILTRGSILVELTTDEA